MGRETRARDRSARSARSAGRAGVRSSSASSAGYLPPSATDRRRFRAFRSGQSLEEIADRDRVDLKTVESGILRVRIHNQQFSAEEVGVEVRQLFAGLIPEMNRTLRGALRATRYEGIVTQFIDKATGEVQTVESQVERPDHEVRMRAIDAARGIIAVVQPRDPAVQITSTTTNNTQNNLLGVGQPAAGAGALGPGMTSPEAVIRAIQAQRGYALTDGRVKEGEVVTVTSPPSAKIFEAEARVVHAEEVDEDEEEEGDEDVEEEEEDTD